MQHTGLAILMIIDAVQNHKTLENINVKAENIAVIHKHMESRYKMMEFMMTHQ